MEKLNKVIYSKESKTGVAIQIFGVVCFFAAIPLLHTSTKSNSPALYLFFAGFFSFSILLWVIGSYQRRKFSKLGKTPLTLTPSVCIIGEEFKCSIEIRKPDFNSVKEISITLWQRRKTVFCWRKRPNRSRLPTCRPWKLRSRPNWMVPTLVTEQYWIKRRALRFCC